MPAGRGVFTPVGREAQNRSSATPLLLMISSAMDLNVGGERVFPMLHDPYPALWIYAKLNFHLRLNNPLTVGLWVASVEAGHYP